MRSTPERQPSDFADILCGAELPLLVGGQAVNLWAEVYRPALPMLESFEPFVSKDADIYGTRAMAEMLARRAGWELHFDPRPESIVAAILRKQPTLGGPSLTVEVLGEVNGLNEMDLGITAVVESGTTYSFRVPAPPVLLKAKLYNLVSLVTMERPQDLKHAQMLCEIVPHYLNELYMEFRGGRASETTFAKAINYTADVITSGYAGSAANSRGLDLSRVIPSKIWLAGPASLDAIRERLKKSGLVP